MKEEVLAGGCHGLLFKLEIEVGGSSQTSALCLPGRGRISESHDLKGVFGRWYQDAISSKMEAV